MFPSSCCSTINVDVSLRECICNYVVVRLRPRSVHDKQHYRHAACRGFDLEHVLNRRHSNHPIRFANIAGSLYYNVQTSPVRFKGRLHSTRRSRRVYADIYAISVAYHFREMDLFYMSRKSLRIRIGCGLLANENPASTHKRRRIVGVFTLST